MLYLIIYGIPEYDNTMTLRKMYTTKDVLKKVGISRNTLFLWLKKGKIPEVARDRNGHRVFTSQDVSRIIQYKDKMIAPGQLSAEFGGQRR